MQSSLDSLVPATLCDNSQRLEDYFTLAFQLRLKAKQLLSVQEDLEAYIALKQFKDLTDGMERHNAIGMQRYRALRFEVGRERGWCERMLGEVGGRILRGQDVQRKPREKRVLLAKGLAAAFSRAAQANTVRNVETLGILGGTLESGSYMVKGIVLPPQRGASDSCGILYIECMDDPGLFSALESRQWMALGWIHSHPDHGLFLSSVDMHTQGLYQQMLPEAIAIVVSQREGVGVFRLSPQGLADVKSCSSRGFHPHSDRITVPAAVSEHSSAPLLIDLR